MVRARAASEMSRLKARREACNCKAGVTVQDRIEVKSGNEESVITVNGRSIWVIDAAVLYMHLS